MQITNATRAFLKLESAGGIVLVAAAAVAMLLANSPLQELYNGLLDIPAEVRIGSLELAKPILLWINDGLMAIFFLLVGLEVKREMREGELSRPADAFLPAAAAVGGMVVPAAIYIALNAGDPAALNGWAIPAATDIAFALGVLALLGRAVPDSLKIFLLTVAIIDDLAAIAIIAVFYSGDLSIMALWLALAMLVVLFVLNRAGVTNLTPYILVGVLLWVFVLKSGVHATLAGVATAFAIPIRDRKNPDRSPLRTLEHKLHPWVAFAIMPLFAFANAGLPLRDLPVDLVFHPVPLGIFLGLVLGKPIGVTLFSILAIRLGPARMPEGASMLQLAGVGMLAGIGFTMSLFIASLAFEHGATQYLLADRLGILAASVVAGLLGYTTLRLAARK